MPPSPNCPRSGSGLVHAIRPSTPSDGDDLVHVWRTSVDATHTFVSSEDLLEIEIQIRPILCSHLFWIAVDEPGHPLGFMGLSTSSVDALFIAAEHRGRGVGRALMEFAKKDRDFLTTVVNEQNEQALGFYEHVGFRVESRSPIDDEGRPYPVLRMRWERQRA